MKALPRGGAPARTVLSNHAAHAEKVMGDAGGAEDSDDRRQALRTVRINSNNGVGHRMLNSGTHADVAARGPPSTHQTHQWQSGGAPSLLLDASNERRGKVSSFSKPAGISASSLLPARTGLLGEVVQVALLLAHRGPLMAELGRLLT